MDSLVFAAVLAAGAMHAGWNAIVKIKLEPLLAITLISIAYCLLIVPFAPFVDWPVASAWPYLGASLAIHGVYYYGLGQAYRAGDLGHVYPIARGTAPLLTAIGAYLLVGEDLGPRGTLGVLVLTSGIMLLSLKGGRAGVPFDRRSVLFALLTALAISAYTLVDGIGARQSVDPFPYIYWLMLLDGLMMLLFGMVYWGPSCLKHSARTWALLLFAGLMSMLAYGIAIWAMARAPIALVAALRETSVLFAALIGIVFLREPIMPVRLVAAAIVMAGVMLVRMR
jgi:drug/metabolite transporter (DMT)-like permease